MFLVWSLASLLQWESEVTQDLTSQLDHWHNG